MFGQKQAFFFLSLVSLAMGWTDFAATTTGTGENQTSPDYLVVTEAIDYDYLNQHYMSMLEWDPRLYDPGNVTHGDGNDHDVDFYDDPTTWDTAAGTNDYDMDF